MRRREFIAGLGSGAAWPVVARAQQQDRPRRIVVLLGSGPVNQHRISIFRQRLAELGWVEGKNVSIDWRTGLGDPERSEAELRLLLDDLVHSAPDVIVSANATIGLLQRATRTIPVVFVLANDPLAEGYIASLAHPGGNLTGFAFGEAEIGSKQLQLLKDAVPHLARAASLYDPQNVGMKRIVESQAAAARRFGLAFSATPVRTAAEIRSAVEELADQPNGGMLLPSNAPININLPLIIELAQRHRIPTVGVFRFFAAAGGLMSYGTDEAEMFRGAAGYVDRILRGEKPADMPVQQPTKFELVINAKTAKALGLTIPETLLATADELIQ
jgi:putative tryptophan/tyrosine transport system substrate-binding protein